MINLAVVGTGEITEKFLGGCKLTNRFLFHTVYSRSSERGKKFAETYGFLKNCDDIYNVASDPEIDAVYIASPNVFHYEQSKIFLENNKHVICEKPIVTEVSQYEELLSMANSKKLIYMEAIMGPHYAGHTILHNALSEIGNISQARIDFCQLSSRWKNFKSGEKVNIFDMSLHAGTLMDLGVYCVYMAVDLFGKPLDISASASFLKGGADGAGTAIFKYNDFLATLTYSKTAQSVVGSEIIGDRAAVKIDSVSQYVGISLVKDGKKKILLDRPLKTEVMSGEAEKFSDYIENSDIYKDDYDEKSKLTRDVHFCMDLIKKKANINYH